MKFLIEPSTMSTCGYGLPVSSGRAPAGLSLVVSSLLFSPVQLIGIWFFFFGMSVLNELHLHPVRRVMPESASPREAEPFWISVHNVSPYLMKRHDFFLSVFFVHSSNLYKNIHYKLFDLERRDIQDRILFRIRIGEEHSLFPYIITMVLVLCSSRGNHASIWDQSP